MEHVVDILQNTGALLNGHFLLSSGLHSDRYVQCAKLLRFPDQAEKVLRVAAEQIKNLGATKICGPAMGGVIVSYELGRQLGIEAIFTERKDGQMQLRRGFEVGPNDRIIISEDVVTTGKSTMETVKVLEDMGAKVIGVACIADRRSADCVLDFPLYSCVKLQIETYNAKECPLCKTGTVPLVKPGSREMKER
jgi:orotate phosphoribosyltransferase